MVPCLGLFALLSSLPNLADFAVIELLLFFEPDLLNIFNLLNPSLKNDDDDPDLRKVFGNPGPCLNCVNIA